MRRDVAPETTKLGHYAGPVTRLVAFVIDVALSSFLFALSVAVLLFILDLVSVVDVGSDDIPGLVSLILFAAWQWLYFGGSWSASGKTPGMALLGLRVVNHDGSDLESRRGIVRAPALALSIAIFGIGLVGVVLSKQNRGLQDVIAGTVVVYDWDARAARLRFLARRRAPAVQ